ncbi:MAG: hypothetical protein KDD35_03935, partial [Bdellovibrionales bacterium]|nr:hypothetical protein [Bdellovibrionales bacterium]
MRILCLNLQREAESSFAENFLQLSPLLQLRKPGFIFADITGTSHLFGGEKQLLHQALKLARQSYPEVRAAIAGSPASAQVFAQWQTPSAIIPPGQARTSLLALPLTALCDLEGLVPWISLKEIKSIISFFESLALDSISQLTPLRVEAWRERWGKTGEILWRKIHGLEKQIISPFIPSAILVEFIHLDWPLTSLNSLLEYLQEGLRRLCLRLEGRSEQARIVNIHLHCEYSQQSYRVKIQLQQGSREVHLLLKLLENKLALLQLDNPIRSIEIEIVPCSERILQLDFFSPRAHDSNRLNQLFSLFRQNS